MVGIVALNPIFYRYSQQIKDGLDERCWGDLEPFCQGANLPQVQVTLAAEDLRDDPLRPHLR